jgi:hypothetical protein
VGREGIARSEQRALVRRGSVLDAAIAFIFVLVACFELCNKYFITNFFIISITILNSNPN